MTWYANSAGRHGLSGAKGDAGEKLVELYCKKNNLEVNPNQLTIINELNSFHNLNFKKSILKRIFSKKNCKAGFYLQGDVGVGKTMILNFLFNEFLLVKYY